MSPRVLIVLCLTALAGCGGGGGSGDRDPASVVPADRADSVIELALGPHSAAGKRFLALADRVNVSDRSVRDQFLDRLDASGGDDVIDQIEPWIGDRVTLASTRSPAGFVIVAQVRDRDALQDVLDKEQGERMSYHGVDYTNESQVTGGVVRGLLVVASSEDGFRAAVDTAEGGASLLDRPRWKAARQEAGDDRFALFDFSEAAFLEGLVTGASEDTPEVEAPLRALLATGGDARLTGSVRAKGDAIVGEVTLPSAGHGTGPAAGGAPVGSWISLAAGIDGARIGTQVRKAIGGGRFGALYGLTGLDAYLRGAERLRFYVGGDADETLFGGLGLEGGSGAQARAVLDGAARATEALGFRARPNGTAVELDFGGDPISLRRDGGKVVAAFGAPIGGPLSGDAEYQRARTDLGGAAPSVFVDFVKATAFAGSGKQDDPDLELLRRVSLRLRRFAVARDGRRLRFVLRPRG